MALQITRELYSNDGQQRNKRRATNHGIVNHLGALQQWHVKEFFFFLFA
jgi:hypothetical protein